MLRYLIKSTSLNLKSRFIEMFGHIDCNEKNFDMMTLDSISIRITDGAHYSPLNDPSGHYPMMSVKDIREHGFDYSDCKHICAEEYQKLVSSGCKPQIDDILIAKDGATAFKKGFIFNDPRDQAVLSSIAIIRPDLKIVDPTYLITFLLSNAVQANVLKNFTTGTAITRIILKDLKKLHILVPPIELQNQFADFVKQVDKSKFLLATMRNLVLKLTNYDKNNITFLCWKKNTCLQ